MSNQPSSNDGHHHHHQQQHQHGQQNISTTFLSAQPSMHQPQGVMSAPPTTTSSPIGGFASTASPNSSTVNVAPSSQSTPATPISTNTPSTIMPSHTSTTATTTTQIPQKEVSTSSFEFLYIELVDYIIKSSNDKTQTFKKLEKMGFKVGYKMVERLCLDLPLFPEVLEIVKFICRSFWTAVFKKSIDGLKANRKGVFVMTDQKFQWLLHLSYDPTSTNKDCSEYVQFAVGLIKGAMSNFGYKCMVTFEIQQMHAVVFTIKLES
ncbi:hypothetical protein DFA_00939 [Cavenderia fasciculata]|uniref:Transport protein particle component n=1 Tax=Cavenderia fasciculata TaxID=261658 RepID=F4PUP7_CACFS|nr:uncharacterized protein DFA_00939 [Cavenderia fasciculata]EGG21066.1 hypothetical protein DFA_00939 [Cavenderia fasciculata]|eukprot:XP_004358916.1 hypothetical protein DFA_00939 [Cavenderia fasciculata]